MATTFFGNTAAANTSLVDRLVARITAWRADYAKYRVFRKTLGELQVLSDRDLADLGLNRSMLVSVAVEAAYGK